MNQNILNKIRKEGIHWIWIGAIDKDGFPRLGARSARQKVYEVVKGSPPKECLTPDCEIKLCVNPDCLKPIDREDVAPNHAIIETRKAKQALDQLKD